MRFVVAQIGARRGYAVPLILEKAGLLERFYTDLAGNVGLGKWGVKVGCFLGWGSRARKLAGRRVPQVLLAKTASMCSPIAWLASYGAKRMTGQRCGFRQQLQWQTALGRAMARRGFGAASHLYSMLGECGPLLGAAKEAGLTTVTEFYILSSAERIVAKEQQDFPGWENPSEDLEAIRNEFPDQTRVLSRTDLAICPSERVKADLEQSLGDRPRHGVVVPYGLNEEWLTLTPRPVRGRVLFVGTAGLRKGIHYLAEAARQLREKGRSYEFRVAGEVATPVRFHPACDPLNFLGRLEKTAVTQEFLNADVFVLPTLAEGSAEATYEALGAGLPVITTAAAGSVIRDRIEGYIVPERDPESLAAAIERVIENRLLRESFSKASRLRASEYTWEKYGARLLTTIREFAK